jgi:hypothetical protein
LAIFAVVKLASSSFDSAIVVSASVTSISSSVSASFSFLSKFLGLVFLLNFILNFSFGFWSSFVEVFGFAPARLLVGEHVFDEVLDPVGNHGFVLKIFVFFELFNDVLELLLLLLVLLGTLLEVLTDFVHQRDCTFHSQVVDCLVHVTDAQKGLEHRNQHSLRKELSAVQLTDEVEVSVEFESEKDGRLLGDVALLFLVSVKELLEALLANLEEGLSEDGILHSTHALFLVSELQLKLDHFFAKFSVEDNILFL